MPPEHVEKLAGAIASPLSEDALRLKMGQSAKRRVEEEGRRTAMHSLKAHEKVLSVHKLRMRRVAALVRLLGVRYCNTCRWRGRVVIAVFIVNISPNLPTIAVAVLVCCNDIYGPRSPR